METGLIIFLSIIAFAIVFGIQWLIADSFYKIACLKGHGEKKYFHFCLWLGIVGWIMVAALPDHSGSVKETIRESTEQKENTPYEQTAQKEPVVEIRERGNCELCNAQDVEIVYCKIVDDYGVRYRKLCADCMAEKNATPAK